jgi:hypothetical protein
MGSPTASLAAASAAAAVAYTLGIAGGNMQLCKEAFHQQGLGGTPTRWLSVVNLHAMG